MANPIEQPDPTKVVGRRVVAAIIDFLIILVPTFLLVTANFEYTEVSDLKTSAAEYCETYEQQTDGVCYNAEDIDDRVYYSDSTTFYGPAYLWFSSFLLLVVLQALTGWSPGKLLLGLRVVKGDGTRPGFGKVAGRWALLLVDLFPYFIPGLTGFIAALSTPGHRRIGDVAARTFVVKRAAVGTPIGIGDSGQLLIGEEQASGMPPAWAPPPAAPGVVGATDPGDPGWENPAPPPPEAPPAAAPAPTPSTEGPQWDEARGTYIQWDPEQSAWMQWDEGFKAWIRIPGQ